MFFILEALKWGVTINMFMLGYNTVGVVLLIFNVCFISLHKDVYKEEFQKLVFKVLDKDKEI